MSLITNSEGIAKEASGIARGTTPQSAIQDGARVQRSKDVSWTLGVLTITMPERPMFWDDPKGELPDAEEVQKARTLEIEYFQQNDLLRQGTDTRCAERRTSGSGRALG